MLISESHRRFAMDDAQTSPSPSRADTSQTLRWTRWLRRSILLPVLLLVSVLALAAAAIAYVSWPLVFVLVVIGAGAWCRHLEREPDGSDRTETT